MPKILENIRERLLAETQKQITEQGYAATSVRSIANACGIAVGTVYRYFPSKDMLIAYFVFEDWQRAMQTLKSRSAEEPQERLRQLYDMLRTFSADHSRLFNDPEAKKTFAAMFSERHAQLCSQLAEFLAPICRHAESPAFLAQYLAESVLTWTMAGTPFEILYAVLEKLISKEMQ